MAKQKRSNTMSAAARSRASIWQLPAQLPTNSNLQVTSNLILWALRRYIHATTARVALEILASLRFPSRA
jgi:hypothetical protein